MQQKSIKDTWIDFLICFFFGVYGVHKFREKKIGIGILYLFTGGLFVFGWLSDCIKLFITALKTSFSGTKMADSINTESANGIKQFFTAHWKKIALGIGAFYLLIFIIAIASSPNIDSSNNDNTLNGINATLNSTEDSLSTDSSIDDTTDSTATSTTETTTETTTEATTEATTETTVEPTTKPTEPPHVHKYSAATCTEPKTCSCGATEGSANGHNWQDATYTSPKTCTACGTTEGTPLDVPGKENYHGHVYTGGSSSKKYHYESQCAEKNSHEITWDEVERRGLGPCGTCVLK